MREKRVRYKLIWMKKITVSCPSMILSTLTIMTRPYIWRSQDDKYDNLAGTIIIPLLFFLLIKEDIKRQRGKSYS